MRTIAADLMQAMTMARRRPAPLVVPVLTLAVGIGACTALYSALHAALFTPLPYAEPHRLVMGRATFGGEVNPWVAGPDFYDYRDRSSVFQSLSAYFSRTVPVTLNPGGEAESVPLALVSWDLFGTLGVDPVLGRHFSPDEGDRGGRRVAIVSHGYWTRSLGGTADVLGRTLPLTLGGRAETPTIVGVMPAGFRFAYAADIWLPMQRNGPGTDVRRFHNWLLVGRLKPGVGTADAQRQVDRISAQLEKEYPDSNRSKALLLTPLQEALTEADRPGMFVLLAAVGVLLLAACADVAGLLLSRGAERQTEMAVRSALGASRARLIRQLLAESAVVAIAAGVLGLMLASWLRSLVLRLVPLDGLGVTSLPLDGPVLAFSAIATVLATVLIGMVPAWLGAGPRPAADLKAGSRTTDARGRALVRQGLVAGQVAVAVVLLVSAALLGRSLLRLRAVDPGIRTDHLLTAQLSLAGPAYRGEEARRQFFGGLTDEVRGLAGVVDASAVNMVPVLDRAGNIPVWDAAHPPAQISEAPLACARFVLPGYFRTMGIPLVEGRLIDDRDTPAGSARAFSPSVGAAPTPIVNVVISRSVARRIFPGVGAVGRRMGVFAGGPEPVTAEVVGIVGDVRMNGLNDEDTTALYVPYQVAAPSAMRLVVRTAAAPESVVPALRAALARRDRGLVLTEVKAMDDIIGASLEGFGLRAGAVALFGGAALVLTMLGIYGVLASAVQRRRRDIGLRIALGAPRRRLLISAVATGMAPVGLGLSVGLAGAYATGSWLRGQLFGVQPTDGATYGGVLACLVLAALAACVIPAWRAARVDPAVALRAE